MKLAVVSKLPPPSEGISDFGRHLVEGFGRRPDVDRVIVLANATRHPVRSPLAAGELRRIWHPNDPRLALQILRGIAELRPDVVWYNVSLAMFGDGPAALPGFLLPAITRRQGIRSVVTLHEQPTDRLDELGARDSALRRAGVRLATRLLGQADVVCVTTDRSRRALRHWSATAQIVHIPLCGYGEPELAPFPERASALMLTSHAPHKNLPILLEAFARVRAALPCATLVLAGIDHPRFPGYLAECRRRYGNPPGVSWRGEVAASDVRSLICQATVMVAPYRLATGSSATLHQAIGLGRPVIVSDLPEFRAVAEEEDLWLEFCPRDDASRMAELLDRLFRDRAYCQAIAVHNHHSARRNSLATTLERYLRLFQPSPRPATLGVPWPVVSAGRLP